MKKRVMSAFVGIGIGAPLIICVPIWVGEVRVGQDLIQIPVADESLQLDVINHVAAVQNKRLQIICCVQPKLRQLRQRWRCCFKHRKGWRTHRIECCTVETINRRIQKVERPIGSDKRRCLRR